MRFQDRDRQLLHAIYRHRYLSTRHIRDLLFPGKSIQSATARLSKLWRSRLVHKNRLLKDGFGTQVLYSLAKRGAEIVADDFALKHLPPCTHTQNKRGFGYLEHQLVVTDILIALQAKQFDPNQPLLVGFERETRLRQKLSAYQARQDLKGATSLVSDGAFTLFCHHWANPQTFHLEVVRARVSGGNKTLLQKMKQYAHLNRSRYFQHAFGHNHVRAVLFVTTTEKRARHFQQLASQLPYGHNLFWFGSYEQTKSPASHKTPNEIVWLDGHGNKRQLC